MEKENINYHKKENDRISADTIKQIRKRMYALLDKQGEASYDYHHVRRVEAECVQLAARRGLDIGMAEVIGLLHDIGRVEMGVYSKDHSVEGSKRAQVWLREFNVPMDVITEICEAISVHNQKKTIHGTYSELIKDADAMAHSVEFEDELSKYEKIRSKCAVLDPIKISYTSVEKFYETLEIKISELKKHIIEVQKDKISGEEIHLLRVNIRSIKGFLVLLKDTKQWKQYKKLNKELYKLFKLLEMSRKLTVFKKSLKLAGIKKSKYSCIKKSINKENKKINTYLRKNISKLSDLLDREITHEIDQDEFKIALRNRIHIYKNALVTADVASIKSIHLLRIMGKAFKYLVENQVVLIDNIEDAKLINELHISIGKLHDIEENRFLLSQNKGKKYMDLSKKSVNWINGGYSIEKSKESKYLNSLIFTMRIRSM